MWKGVLNKIAKFFSSKEKTINRITQKKQYLIKEAKRQLQTKV